MTARWMLSAVTAALFALGTLPALSGSDAAAPGNARISPEQIAKIVPGQSTKADVRSLFGVPWREVQFNDCGMAMDDQADETWEYRGADADGSYRIHVEFGDNGVVHLLAKIPDRVLGGKATEAKAAAPSKDMSM